MAYSLAALAISVAVLLTILELCFRCRDRALTAAAKPKSSFALSAMSGVPRLMSPLRSSGASLGASGGERYEWLNDRPTPGNRFLGLVKDGSQRGRTSMV